MSMRSSFCGAHLLAVWYGIGLLFKRAGVIQVRYHLLQMVPGFFDSISYLFLEADQYTQNTWRGYLFERTPAVAIVGEMCFLLWTVGVFANLVLAAMKV